MSSDAIEAALEPARAGRVEESIASLTELAARKGPTEAEALGHLGWLLRTLGRGTEARAAYARLRELRPDDGEAQAIVADLDRLDGRPMDAVRQAAELIARDPGNWMAMRVMAAGLASLGVQPLLAEAPTPSLGLPAPQPIKAFNAALEKLESWPGSYPFSSYPEVARLVYCIVRCLRPQIVVETGTYRACSTITMAQALEDSGLGHVHSFDIFMERPGEVSPILGECSDSFRVASGHIEAAGLTHRVTLHRGDSAAQIEQFFARNPMKIDFAFVDGDHTEKGALRDINAIVPHLVPGGVILLHDTMPDSCGWLGPRRAIDRAREAEELGIDVVNLPTPEGFGLALLQKRGAHAGPFELPGVMRMLQEDLYRRALLRKR